MILAALAATLLAQAPLPPNASSTLPPGHPPLDGTAPPAPPPPAESGLPPGHPSVDGPPTPAAALPPGHPATAGQGNARPSSAADLIKRLDATPGLRDQDRPFELSLSMAQLYLDAGRYADARGFYEGALKKAEPVRALLAEQMKLRGKGPDPTPEASGCVPGPTATLAKLLQKAQEQAAAKQAGAAVVCAQVAMRAVQTLEADLGRVRYLEGDSAGAIAAYERALATFPGNVAARYGRAAIWLDGKPDDLKSLAQVKAELETVLTVGGPGAPQAKQARRLIDRVTRGLAAGGLSKLPLEQGPLLEHAAARVPPRPTAPPFAAGPGASGSAPMLDPAVMQAMAEAGKSPEAQARVQGIIATGEENLAKGRYQEALDAFKSGMPIAPTNGRLRAGLAWALAKLNKPTAERIWSVALETPDDIAALSDTLESKGDAEGAKALRQKLVQAVPALAARYAGKL